jgi:hypothetical protein
MSRERGVSAPKPAWVVCLGRLAIATAVAFIAAHLAGKGMGGHGFAHQ